MNNQYVLVAFPYPSGSGLHVGHWYNYAIADSYCRYLRYNGAEVFQPFGYDAFGLPAENYAKSVGRDPRDVTDENIVNFRRQMTNMDTCFKDLLSTHSI
jgi:leucyl-tRNA synthetase